MCYLRNLRSGNSRDNGSEGGATALRMLGGQSGIAAAGGFDLETFSWGFADKKMPISLL